MDKTDFWVAVTLWSVLIFAVVALGLSIYGILVESMLWVRVLCIFFALFSFSAFIVTIVIIYILLKE